MSLFIARLTHMILVRQLLFEFSEFDPHKIGVLLNATLQFFEDAVSLVPFLAFS
jgi:hypothetical protein